MLASNRTNYNQTFTTERYLAFKKDIAATYDHEPPFRLAETPIFVPTLLKKRLVEACHEISQTIYDPRFKEWSEGAFAGGDLKVPAEDDHTLFLQMDFGICHDEAGDLIPQLIEVQGFPSLYFFQELLAKKFQEHFDIPDNYSCYFDGLEADAYIELLRKNIIGETDPKQVVLLEIEPEKQATCIDFLCAQDKLGLKVLCISQLKREGKSLYYLDKNGEKVRIQKIFNRVIFDELLQRNDLPRTFSFKDEVDVEWMGHPNWFYRISKYILPLLSSQYVPESFYLNQLEEYPTDLENYVLKPLFSFAGAGVNLHINKDILDSIENKGNFIIQKKVQYQPVLETPNNERAKCEIRMLMLWEKEAKEAKIINNLARITKGEMVGVKYNRDKEWVGASVAF
ncbi:MAG: hypothetical protein AAGJ18_23265, partial [Bacteroidota bacterium]